MSIGPNQLTQFQYLLSKVQEKNFMDTRTDLPDVCGEYTRDGDTSRGQDYRDATSVGLGQYQETGEFGQFHKDGYEPGQEIVVTWKKYTNGLMVSEELLLYMERNKRVYEDKVKMFQNINQDLKDTWQWTKEVLCTKFQTAGNVTTGLPGACRDSLALFSASHTSIKTPVQTISNIVGSQPFSQMLVQDMVSALQNQVDDAGRPQGPVTSVTFIIGRWWEWQASIVFGTDKQVGTLNNDINPIVNQSKADTKRTYRYIVNPYLSSTDTSVVALDDKYHKLTRFEALAPRFQTERDISTGANIYKSTAIFGIAPLSFRGAALSAGV